MTCTHPVTLWRQCLGDIWYPCSIYTACKSMCLMKAILSRRTRYNNNISNLIALIFFNNSTGWLQGSKYRYHFCSQVAKNCNKTPKLSKSKFRFMMQRIKTWVKPRPLWSTVHHTHLIIIVDWNSLEIRVVLWIWERALMQSKLPES